MNHHGITRAYYRNTIGVILVYNVTNAESLKSMNMWLKEIYDNSNEAVGILILGNKAD